MRIVLLLGLLFLVACTVDELPQQDYELPTQEKTFCSGDMNEICAQNYDPVCGSDSRTYSNGCVACTNPTVLWHAPGNCVWPQGAMPCKSRLDCVDQTVCATDAVSYASNCVACDEGNAWYVVGSC